MEWKCFTFCSMLIISSKTKMMISWFHRLHVCFINKQKTIKAAKKSMENGNVSVRFVFGSNGFLGDHSFYVEYIRNVKNNIVLGVAHSSVIHFFVLILEMEIMGNCLRQMCFVLLLCFFSSCWLVRCVVVPICFYISHFWN